MTAGFTIHVLLYAAVVTALLSAIGLLVMKELNDKLHYLAPPPTLSVFMIAAAVGIAEGFSQAFTKTILCAIILALTSPVLTHATARAARIRHFGHWVSQPEEQRSHRSAGD